MTNDTRLRRNATIAVLSPLVMLALIQPALAQEALEPVENVLQYAVDLITGPIGRLIAIIAVAAAGILTMVGRIEGKTFVGIFAGVALIFGAAAIVDTIGGTFGGDG